MSERQSRRALLRGIASACAGVTAGCSTVVDETVTTRGPHPETAETTEGESNREPVDFWSTALSLSGGVLSNPTSLGFGADGRLYVAQQRGTIHAFGIERRGLADYAVRSHEVVTAITDIPNHDDDGSPAPTVAGRQVTGVLTAGTETDPVLYVTSSDPRHQRDRGERTPAESLDTNSGTLSKLTRNGSDWEHVLLVRGLPRSRLDHSTNGMALDESTGTLYVAQGSHTNMGAPSDKFGDLPEYALSGAVLSVDLPRLESMPTGTDFPVPYVYDLPTLGGTDVPFGGRAGANMAKLVEDGPVQVYSPGYRNPYDLTLTTGGELYTVDNAESDGSGAPPLDGGPEGTCANAPREGGRDRDEELHRVTEGYYGGHPNPTRGNPDGAGLFGSDGTRTGGVAGAVYDGYDSPVECDYRGPAESGQLATFGSSTNGLAEYTASTFGGSMQGALLAASFSGLVWRVDLGADGTTVTDETPLVGNAGEAPLDVAAQGDDGPYPGTVWVASFGSDEIRVFEPDDG